MRVNNSIYNSTVNFISNIISFIMAFICQRFFLKIFGIEYLGLSNLFLNIFTVLNLFDSGIVNVIVFSLLKPIADNNKEKIKSLINFYKKVYYVIITIIFTLGLCLLPFLDMIVNGNVDVNIYILYFLFLMNAILSYFVMDKRCIIFAYQKYYVVNIIHVVEIILLSILRLSILFLTKNLYLYVLATSFCLVLENLAIRYVVNKKYPFLLEKNVKPLNKKTLVDIKKKTKSLFIHKTSTIVISGTDSIIISIFLGLRMVGIYANYYYIMNSINSLFSNFFSSNTASIGNLLLEEDFEKRFSIFQKIRFLNYGVAIFTSCCLFVLTQPFITMWIGQEYLLSNIILLVLVLNHYQTLMHSTFSAFKDSAGIWVEDRVVPIIEVLLNIICSILFLKLFGIIGVFLGTIVSSIPRWFYSYPKYIYKKLFGKDSMDYYKEFIQEIGLFFFFLITTYYVCNAMIIQNVILSLFIKGIVCCFLQVFLFVLFFRKREEWNYFVTLIKLKLRIHK